MKDTVRGSLITAIIIIAIASYYAIWGCQVSDPQNNSGGSSTAPSGPMREGQPAPVFSGITIDGVSINLADYKGEKAVVLDFFATWCGPCLLELPVLQAFYEQHSDEVEIIAVTSEAANKLNEIKSVIADKGVTFPVMHDTTQTIGRLYPTRSIPYLVLIDKNGVAIGTHLGYDPNIGRKLIAEFGLSE